MAKKKLAARDYLPVPVTVPPIGCDEPGCTETAFSRLGTRNLCHAHFKAAPRLPTQSGTSCRTRWYAERRLSYEPPKLKDCPPHWACIGNSANRPKLPERKREPGDDDGEIAA